MMQQIDYQFNNAHYIISNEVILANPPSSDFVKVTAKSVYGGGNPGFREIQIFGYLKGSPYVLHPRPFNIKFMFIFRMLPDYYLFINSCIYLLLAKMLGSWENEGTCIATYKDENGKACGEHGHIKQRRTCVDGTYDKCKPEDTEQTTACDAKDETGNPLPSCPGKSSLDNFTIEFFSLTFVLLVKTL